MNRLCVVALLCCLCVAGCLSPEAKTIITDNAKNAPLFAADAQAGKVTTDQFIRWVQADAQNWMLLNNIVQGIPPAPKPATVIPATGVQP
jgi:hypothetical protein